MNWPQLQTILWLRWRLTRNQWARSGGLGAILAAIVAVASAVMSVSSFAGALTLGIFALGHSSANVLMFIWLALTAAFLLMWLIGLIQDLQRSEGIDLQRLLHLPVALGQMFVINYVGSLLAVSTVVFVPAMIGLAIGLAISRGSSMLWLVPLALAMVFMVTAWTYYLHGWLATLMNNPRRRRVVIMSVTAAVIILAQAPNLYFNVFRRIDAPALSKDREARTRQLQARSDARERQVSELIAAEPIVPLLWVPYGALTLADGRVLPALAGTIGGLVIGAWGLRRAYRSTLRLYRGESGKKPAPAPAAPKPGSAPRAKERLLVERSIPGIPEQASALAVATTQSMLRAPEIKMQFGTSFIVSAMVGTMMLFRAQSKISATVQPFIATAAVAFALFMLVQFLSNQFGMDRDGFRALVLSPADRRQILLGKNLACLPAGALSALMLLTVVAVVLRPSPVVLMACVLQLVAGLLVTGIGGNLLSILVPYRIQAGSLKPTKVPGLAMVMIVLGQLTFPLLMAPLFLPPLAGLFSERVGGPPAMLMNLAISGVMAVVMALVYWKVLDPLSRLLQRRETQILGIVTVDVE